MYAERRRRFLEAIGEGAVAILLGARPATRSHDTHYPFRQDSDFWYLTGFAHPNAVAVLRGGVSPRFSLFVEPREREAETWNGFRPGLEGAVRDFGADDARPTGEFLQALPDLIAGAQRIHHVLGRDPAVDARLVQTLDSMRLRSRAGLVPAAEIVDPRSVIHEMRLRKSDDEMATMRRGAAITREAHAAAARIAQPGAFEYELEAVLDYTFRRNGATGPAYASIVGGGANATTLHYVRNDQKLEADRLVLIDAGCELAGYASDVTRCYPVGGSFRGADRDVYEVVLAAQLAALAVARPGATLAAIHDTAVRSLTRGLVDLGLLQGSVDELIEKQAYRRYYMHNTSHWLGLDVHDVGAYVQAGAPRPLEPGMVFTVEPGLYVPADDEQAPAQLRGIGVRIEDDVLVTRDGIEVLTAAIPKSVPDVEAWVRGA
jgi:Xaa-Pro aminopeptidase